MQLSTLHSPLRSDSVTALSERAHLLCALARKQEEAGDFETACATIREFWERVGDRPHVDGLDEVARGEVLLRAGALSGWIGRSSVLRRLRRI
jgi:hypothetical protein